MGLVSYLRVRAKRLYPKRLLTPDFAVACSSDNVTASIIVVLDTLVQLMAILRSVGSIMRTLRPRRLASRSGTYSTHLPMNAHSVVGSLLQLVHYSLASSAQYYACAS